MHSFQAAQTSVWNKQLCLGEEGFKQGDYPREVSCCNTPHLSLLPSSFQAGNRGLPPPLGPQPDPQETSLLIRLPLSPGFNFPSFIPSHTPRHSTKSQGRGAFQTISPTHSHCGQSTKLMLRINGAVFLELRNLYSEPPENSL